MHSSLEEGRRPLADGAGADGRSLQVEAARRALTRRRVVVFFLLAADMVYTPLVLLAPFSFSISEWWASQIQRWSLGSSAADWIAFSLARDVALGVLAFRSSRGTRGARRLAIGSLLYGMLRLSLMEPQGQTTAQMVLRLLPSAVLAAAAHFLSAASQRVFEGAGGGGTPASAAGAASGGGDAADVQYSSKLSKLQTLVLLRPYFWPSTGEPTEVLINRLRAGCTWGCVTLSKLFNLVSPLFLARATNEVTKQINAGHHPLTSGIALNLIAYAGLIFLSKTLKEAQSLVYIKVQQAAYIEIADETFAHLHSLSLDWHLRKKMGNVIRSMDRGIDAAQKTMQYVFLNLLPTLLEAFAIILIFIFHYENLRLAIFVFVNLVMYIYATVKLTLWRKQFRTAATKSDNEIHDRLTDSMVNYETVKYFTAEDYERQMYRKAVVSNQVASMATQASLSFLNILQQGIVNFVLAGSMCIVAIKLLREGGQLGDFVAVNVYIINVFTPLNFLGTIYNMLVNAVVDMHNFGQLRAETSEVRDAPDARALDLAPRPGAPMVEFRDVSFGYATQPQERSIRCVSFETPRGGSTALVGPTGAGKTTVTRLLFRFYDATSGEVLLNGQDVRSVTQKSVRAAIGMVPQDVVMFNASIAHNIGYGRVGHCTQEQIEEAADRAQLSKFILQQDKGYETVVGERGLKLSGGEKQRLAIARCLVKNPPVVVLDEATSALDSETEQRVQQALEELSDARTVIAIAHRLSTIRHSGEVLVLEAGQVVERGQHAELVAREGSRYASMWQRQAAGIMDEGAAPPARDGAGVLGNASFSGL